MTKVIQQLIDYLHVKRTNELNFSMVININGLATRITILAEKEEK